METILYPKYLLREISFTTSRSSGPGGQNVNKVNSKVTLKFDIPGSLILTPEQKEMLRVKLGTRLTGDGVLTLHAQNHRSQSQNKIDVINKFDDLLRKAFTPIKKRRPTKAGGAARKKRLDTKKKHGEKKVWRRKLE